MDAVGLCEDARAALSVIPYDAAILDLGPPDNDGIALLRNPRSDRSQVPILVLTASIATTTSVKRGARDARSARMVER